MKQVEFDKHLSEATVDPKVTIKAVTLGLYPYFDIMARTATLTAAYLCRVSDANGEYTVITSYHVKDGEPEYGLWCGDKFVEGRSLPESEARSRCAEATTGMAGQSSLQDKMMSNYKAHAASSSCDFWKQWRRDRSLCGHTRAVLAHLRDNNPNFQSTLQDLYEASAAGISATPVGDTMSLSELAFRVPVLFEGDRGAGKTVTARAFARDNGYKRVEFGGHEGMESPDLLGYLVPLDRNTSVWKDGPLSEAFRHARTQKTVLIIDELLRIRQRELSILLTALSPDDGVYRIRTGRVVSVIDGVAMEEELECPVQNLCIVATTNVGSEYAVDEIDPALAERFVIIRMDTNPADLKRILKAVAAKRGLPEKLADQCVSFFLKMTEARTRGLMRHAPTTRTLVRALDLAADKADVVRAIKTQVLLWVARDAEGQPVKEQLEDVTKIIERVFA